MTDGLIGVIGGSGLYRMDGAEFMEEKSVDTPFGRPSDSIMIGKLEGRDVAFLPRHGRGHKIPPHKINYRANIFAMKSIGVERIISLSAVGSMKEEIHAGELLIVDQFIDRTKVREESFFDEIAVHVSFADPVCSNLAEALADAATEVNVPVHKRGTYLCIEGPMFSSRAESSLYRSWNVDVIGMTNYQEAKLSREAEICYSTIALVTDYDCWHEGEEAVDVEQIIQTVKGNVDKAQRTIRRLLATCKTEANCSCHGALQGAIMTAPEAIPEATKVKLQPIIGRYIS